MCGADNLDSLMEIAGNLAVFSEKRKQECCCAFRTARSHSMTFSTCFMAFLKWDTIGKKECNTVRAPISKNCGFYIPMKYFGRAYIQGPR